LDEVHLYDGKIAVLQRPVSVPGSESTVDALHLTTLLPATPKVMLNVDTGDYGVLSNRRCGCLLEGLGLARHLHTIRNYEKLTTGGMHVMGSDIVNLVEEVLPGNHGGAPTDYQMVEEQREDLNRVTIVVSPRVGDVNAEVLLKDVLRYLAGCSRGERMMAEQWMDGESLRVVRRHPYATQTGKIPPLRVVALDPGDRGFTGGRTAN